MTPAFIDTGHAGTWRDMIAHSPLLVVMDYEPGGQEAAGEPGALTFSLRVGLCLPAAKP